MSNATGAGTKTDPWKLHTPPGTAEYDAWRDAEADPPALVVQVLSDNYIAPTATTTSPHLGDCGSTG